MDRSEIGVAAQIGAGDGRVSLDDDGDLVPMNADIEAVRAVHPDAEPAEIYRLAEATAMIRAIAALGDDEDE